MEQNTALRFLVVRNEHNNTPKSSKIIILHGIGPLRLISANTIEGTII